MGVDVSSLEVDLGLFAHQPDSLRRCTLATMREDQLPTPLSPAKSGNVVL